MGINFANRINNNFHKAYKIMLPNIKSNNLSSAIKYNDIKFDRIELIASKDYFPPAIYFVRPKEKTLFININSLFFDSNKPNDVVLNYIFKNAALVINEEKALGSRGLLRNIDRFTFIYDIRSRYFIMAAVDAEISHKGLVNGLSMLRTFNMIGSDIKMLMKGAFRLNGNGRINLVSSTIYDFVPGESDNKELAKGYFLSLGLGLKALGCPECTAVHDMAAPINAFQNFLNKNGISTLGDILKKFSP